MPPRFRAPRILRRREINILLELIIRVVSDWRRRCVSRSVGGRGLRETHRRPRRYMCKIKILSRVFILRRLGRIAKENRGCYFLGLFCFSAQGVLYKSLFTENTVATQKQSSASINTNRSRSDKTWDKFDGRFAAIRLVDITRASCVRELSTETYIRLAVASPGF